jgi:hypothetical protein
LADEVGISSESYKSILTKERNMWWFAAEFVPYLVTQGNMCQYLQKILQRQPQYLSQIITVRADLDILMPLFEYCHFFKKIQIRNGN